MKAANMPESVKSQQLLDAQQHLDLAQVQWQHYNEQLVAAKESATDSPPMVMHYSFNYAQQVHYPFKRACAV